MSVYKKLALAICAIGTPIGFFAAYAWGPTAILRPNKQIRPSTDISSTGQSINTNAKNSLTPPKSTPGALDKLRAFFMPKKGGIVMVEAYPKLKGIEDSTAQTAAEKKSADKRNTPRNQAVRRAAATPYALKDQPEDLPMQETFGPKPIEESSPTIKDNSPENTPEKSKKKAEPQPHVKPRAPKPHKIKIAEPKPPKKTKKIKRHRRAPEGDIDIQQGQLMQPANTIVTPAQNPTPGTVPPQSINPTIRGGIFPRHARRTREPRPPRPARVGIRPPRPPRSGQAREAVEMRQAERVNARQTQRAQARQAQAQRAEAREQAHARQAQEVRQAERVNARQAQQAQARQAQVQRAEAREQAHARQAQEVRQAERVNARQAQQAQARQAQVQRAEAREQAHARQAQEVRQAERVNARQAQQAQARQAQVQRAEAREQAHARQAQEVRQAERVNARQAQAQPVRVRVGRRRREEERRVNRAQEEMILDRDNRRQAQFSRVEAPRRQAEVVQIPRQEVIPAPQEGQAQRNIQQRPQHAIVRHRVNAPDRQQAEAVQIPREEVIPAPQEGQAQRGRVGNRQEIQQHAMPQAQQAEVHEQAQEEIILDRDNRRQARFTRVGNRQQAETVQIPREEVIPAPQEGQSQRSRVGNRQEIQQHAMPQAQQAVMQAEQVNIPDNRQQAEVVQAEQAQVLRTQRREATPAQHATLRGADDEQRRRRNTRGARANRTNNTEIQRPPVRARQQEILLLPPPQPSSEQREREMARVRRNRYEYPYGRRRQPQRRNAFGPPLRRGLHTSTPAQAARTVTNQELMRLTHENDRFRAESERGMQINNEVAQRRAMIRAQLRGTDSARPPQVTVGKIENTGIRSRTLFERAVEFFSGRPAQQEVRFLGNLNELNELNIANQQPQRQQRWYERLFGQQAANNALVEAQRPYRSAQQTDVIRVERADNLSDTRGAQTRRVTAQRRKFNWVQPVEDSSVIELSRPTQPTHNDTFRLERAARAPQAPIPANRALVEYNPNSRALVEVNPTQNVRAVRSNITGILRNVGKNAAINGAIVVFAETPWFQEHVADPLARGMCGLIQAAQHHGLLSQPDEHAIAAQEQVMTGLANAAMIMDTPINPEWLEHTMPFVLSGVDAGGPSTLDQPDIEIDDRTNREIIRDGIITAADWPLQAATSVVVDAAEHVRAAYDTTVDVARDALPNQMILAIDDFKDRCEVYLDDMADRTRTFFFGEQSEEHRAPVAHWQAPSGLLRQAPPTSLDLTRTTPPINYNNISPQALDAFSRMHTYRPSGPRVAFIPTQTVLQHMRNMQMAQATAETEQDTPDAHEQTPTLYDRLHEGFVAEVQNGPLTLAYAGYKLIAKPAWWAAKTIYGGWTSTTTEDAEG